MIPKPISPTELRQNLYNVVREVARGERQYIVTPGEDEGVVMLSRGAYNAMIAERALLRELRRAEAEIAAGKTHSIADVRAFVARRSKPRRRKRAKTR